MSNAFFVVIRTPGPTWDANLPMRAQADWDNHARFMNDLAASGFIIMGGPLMDSQEVLHIVSAEDERTVCETLQRDPWESAGILTTQRVRPWMVLLDSRKI